MMIFREFVVGENKQESLMNGLILVNGYLGNEYLYRKAEMCRWINLCK